MSVFRYSAFAWARMCAVFSITPEDAAVLSSANDACFCCRYPREASEPATVEQIRAAVDTMAPFTWAERRSALEDAGMIAYNCDDVGGDELVRPEYAPTWVKVSAILAPHTKNVLETAPDEDGASLYVIDIGSHFAVAVCRDPLAFDGEGSWQHDPHSRLFPVTEAGLAVARAAWEARKAERAEMRARDVEINELATVYFRDGWSLGGDARAIVCEYARVRLRPWAQHARAAQLTYRPRGSKRTREVWLSPDQKGAAQLVIARGKGPAAPPEASGWRGPGLAALGPMAGAVVDYRAGM